MHRQKRQTPQLHDIAFRRRKRAQRNGLISIFVLPAPDLAAELRAVGVDGIPEFGVRFLEEGVCIFCAES
jgi:hypothetical protein